MESSLSGPYPAEKLDFHARQIRLVSILPGKQSDPVACELRTVHLDKIPDYNTLSYTWGDRSSPCQILLNGVSYNVTRNLEAALRRLRHPTNSLLFWIDMLCIDQDCLEERSHQVNLMQQIYSGTQEVFLWLGDYPETASQTSTTLSRSREDENKLTLQDAVRALVYIKKLSMDKHLEFPRYGSIPPRLIEDVLALGKILNCSWWKRVWTVQEAILPPKATIRIGRLQVSWDTLEAARKGFVKHHSSGCCIIPIAHGAPFMKLHKLVSSINWAREVYHSGVHLRLPHLLHEFRERLSTNPRDKIFALLGLVAGNPNYRALNADYTQSTEDTYKKVFIQLLRDEDSLDLLVRDTEQDRKLDLPTWMPDWSAQVNQSSRDIHAQVMRTLHIYRTSMNTRPQIRWPIIDKTLSIKAFRFDEVARIADPAPNRAGLTDAYRENLETLFDITENRSYIGGGDRAHAIRRLLCMEQMKVSESTTYVNARRATPEDFRKPKNKSHFDRNPEEFDDFVAAFCFFISRKGFIGLGPEKMQVGDTIHIFLGANVPFVLRPRPQHTVLSEQEIIYGFIGNCYVQGIMDGEALHGVDLSNLDWTHII